MKCHELDDATIDFKNDDSLWGKISFPLWNQHHRILQKLLYSMEKAMQNNA